MKKWKNITKRIVSLGLAAVLIANSVPVTALADSDTMSFDDLQTLINSAAEGGTVKLDRDYTAGDSDTALVVPADQTITLDLNGHTIDRGLKNGTAVADGNVIMVRGNLTLTDSSTGKTGTITGGNNTLYGGGVSVNNGTFTMEGGSITDCSATTGTGVYPSAYGGGVYVNNGTFTMEGGSITDCSATGTGAYSSAYGGGVYVNNGTFTMKGGGITNCSAISIGANGGGVSVNTGNFYMNGGSITNCSAFGDGANGGGVYVPDGKTLKVSGTPVISGNNHKASNNASPAVDNVFLSSGLTGKATATVIVTAALGADASIGVRVGDSGNTVIARGTDNYDISTGDAEKFHNDNDTRTLVRDVDADKYVIRQVVSGSWSELRAKLLYGGNTVKLDRNYTAGDSDTALVVPKGKTVTLDLNDHYILYKGNTASPVITVNGSLTLKDSKTTGRTTRYVTLTEGRATSVSDSGTLSATCIEVTGGFIAGGNNENNEGGGVFVNNGGCMFTMEGGTIAGCKSYYGGGVSVYNSGTFTMNGGSIANCTVNSGGGVFVNNGGTFTMNGGSIANCTATNRGNTQGGGGVFVHGGGAFTMEGGSITNCTVSATGNDDTYGGGVFVFSSGAFTMEGGSITNCTANTGGGVYLSSSKFKVSGAPVISGNKKGSDANNVALSSGRTITVTGALTDGAELHINADKGTTVAQIGGTRTDPLTATEAGYFICDQGSQYKAGLNENSQVVFKTALPAIAKATDLTYNGTEQEPELTFDGVSLTAGTDYTVSYKKVVGDTETELSGAPKDVGSYKAVAAGKGSYAGTSEVSFTIAPKPVTVGGIKAKNKVYDATTTATLDCSGAIFAGKADGDSLTVSGTGTFDNKNAGKGKTVTITGLTLGGESAGNYTLTTGNQGITTATITRATPEVTAPTARFFDQKKHTYVEIIPYMENLSNVQLDNPTGNLPGIWTWATDNGINPNETAVGTVGTHVFRAKFTPTDTANYCETTKDVTVTVGKATPKLTIESFSAPYGHPVSVKSSCNSDGEVTYVFYKNDRETKTNTEDGAETEGGPPKNAGTYNIVASVAETSNYLSWEETLVDGCVITQAPNPAVLRSTVTVQRGSDYDLSGLVSDAKGTVSFTLNGSPAGYSLSGSTLTLDSNAAASCTITVMADGMVDGKSNYETFSGEITVNATDLLPQNSFGFTDVAQEKTYGDRDFTVAATGAETGSNVTYSSGNPDVATVEPDTGEVHILKAGETTINATAYETATHAAATASYKLTVYPKPVTISRITANDLVYNSTIAQGITLNKAGAVIAGVVSGDDLTVEGAIGMCDADAGENKTVTIRTITLGGESAGNYTVDLENSQKTTTVNITKADIPDTAITAPTGIDNLVYTGLAQALVAAGTASGGEMRYAISTDTTAPANNLYSASIPTAVNAGTYYVWYMVKGDRNHNDSSSNGPVTVSIVQASGGTINADAVEVQKGNDIQASVNIRGYVGTGAVIKEGTSPQVTPEDVSGISITDISVSNDKNNLTFKVSSANGGNAIITVTLRSDNYNSVTLTIPVKVQDRVTEVKLEAPSNVTSAVQNVEVKGLSDYTQNQNTPSGEPVKVVLDVKPVNVPQGSTVKTKIDNSVGVIFKGVDDQDIRTEYLDISITKQVGDGAANPVGDVGRVLELAIKYDLRGKFHPVVIREHEGTVTAFTSLSDRPLDNYKDSTFYIDEDQGIIYIYSRYFSTFSIASTTVNSYTVSFYAQDGSAVNPIVVADGGKISALPTSTRSGYTLDGWFTYASGGEKLTKDTVITADITYYAQWTKNTSGGGTGGNTGGSTGGNAGGGTGGNTGGGGTGENPGGSTGGNTGGGTGENPGGSTGENTPTPAPDPAPAPNSTPNPGGGTGENTPTPAPDPAPAPNPTPNPGLKVEASGGEVKTSDGKTIPVTATETIPVSKVEYTGGKITAKSLGAAVDTSSLENAASEMITKGDASKLFKSSWVVKNNRNAGTAKFYAKITFDEKKAQKLGMTKAEIRSMKEAVKQINEEFKKNKLKVTITPADLNDYSQNSSEPAKNKLVCTDADGNKLTVKLKKSGKKKVIQSVKVKIGKKTITLDKKQIKKSLTKNEDGTYTITITGKDKNFSGTVSGTAK